MDIPAKFSSSLYCMDQKIDRGIPHFAAVPKQNTLRPRGKFMMALVLQFEKQLRCKQEEIDVIFF